MSTAAIRRASLELQHEIEQFLYEEARLLDEREFHQWLELFAEDIHYWMPTRYNTLRREQHREHSGPDEVAFLDEDRDSLSRRILRLDTGMAWAEDPPSRTRHLFTNIRVVPTERPDEVEVHCAFILYRSRLSDDKEFFVGARTDRLRRVDRGLGWEIARRKIVLDEATLSAKNLSMFF